MGGLRASNFRRIHLGLLLDLLLLVLVPAVLGALLMRIYRQLSAAGLDGATVETLLRSPTLAVRALYAVLALQYCLAALCALPVVSGLGELEAVTEMFHRAKRWFVLLMGTEGLAMLAHLTDVVRPDSEKLSLSTGVWLVSLVLLMLFRALGLRCMLRGFGEVTESVGAAVQARRALRLSRCVTLSAALALAPLLGAFGLYVFCPQSALWRLLRALAVPAFLFYLLCRASAVLCARAVTRRIAALSE